MNLKIKPILPIILILTLVGLGITTAYYYLSTSQTPNVIFTIIASEQGFNGSRSIAGVWPIMSVRLGDIVRIHVVNIDSVEPHGFAIARYFDGGFTIRPNQSFDVTFRATEAGTFRVFCQILCFVHQYMQDGQLVVS